MICHLQSVLDSAGKLYVVPKVTSIEPLVGSWAGGSNLKLIGTGLKPDDEIVTVNFGEAGSQQKGCSIVEVTSTMIVCRVPDFRVRYPALWKGFPNCLRLQQDWQFLQQVLIH